MSFAITQKAKVAVSYVISLKHMNSDEKEIINYIRIPKFKECMKCTKPGFLQILHHTLTDVTEINFKKLNDNKCVPINIISAFTDSKSKYLFITVPDRKNNERNKTLIFGVLTKSEICSINQIYGSFGTTTDMRYNDYCIADEMNTLLQLIQIHCLSTSGQFVTLMKETIKLPLQKIFLRRTNSNNSQQTETPKLRSKRYKQMHSSGSNNSFGNRGSSSKRGLNRTLDKCKSKSIENMEKFLQPDEILGLSIKPIDSSSLLNQPSFNNMIRSSSQSSLSNLKHKKDHFTMTNIGDDSSQFYIFDNVFRDENALKCFHDFLKGEYSAENLCFWLDVNKFNGITDNEKLKKEANRIYMSYIHTSAETPVNLEGHTVSKIKDSLSDPQKDMFNEAKNHVYKLMKTDSYTRFLRSNHFEKWKEMTMESQPIKTASSTSSLNQTSKRRRSYMPAFLKGSRNKLSKDNSRKSSVQTLDSDNNSISMTTTCKITLVFDGNKWHDVSDKASRRLGTVLKRLHKKFNENECTAYNDADNKIIGFNEVLGNLYGQEISVEKSCIIRVGMVQDNMETVVYEQDWFVIRPRHHWCLSSSVDCVVKRYGRNLENYLVVNEDQPGIILPWEIAVYSLNQMKLLLFEKELYKKVKLYGKPLPKILDDLWKNILKDPSSFPYDDDNMLDYKTAFPKKQKIEPRRIGYRSSKSISESNEYVRSLPYNTEDHLELPDFLKQRALSCATDTTDDSRASTSDMGVLTNTEEEEEGGGYVDDDDDDDNGDDGSNQLIFRKSYNRRRLQRRLEEHRLLVDEDEDGLYFSDVDYQPPSPTQFELVSDMES